MVGKSRKKENDKVFTNVIGKLLKTSLELPQKKVHKLHKVSERKAESSISDCNFCSLMLKFQKTFASIN